MVDLSSRDLDTPSTMLAFAAWLRTERPTTTCLSMHITGESCTFLRRAIDEGIQLYYLACRSCNSPLSA